MNSHAPAAHLIPESRFRFFRTFNLRLVLGVLFQVALLECVVPECDTLLSCQSCLTKSCYWCGGYYQQIVNGNTKPLIPLAGRCLEAKETTEASDETPSCETTSFGTLDELFTVNSGFINLIYRQLMVLQTTPDFVPCLDVETPPSVYLYPTCDECASHGDVQTGLGWCQAEVLSPIHGTGISTAGGACAPKSDFCDSIPDIFMGEDTAHFISGSAETDRCPVTSSAEAPSRTANLLVLLMVGIPLVSSASGFG